MSRDCGVSVKLGHLIAEARLDRRNRRLASRAVLGAGSSDHDAVRRYRARTLLERSLLAVRADGFDCSRYFERLATRMQLASGVVAAMSTSISVFAMTTRQAKLVGVLLVDLLRFVEDGATAGASVHAYLAIAIDSDRLVVAFGIEGDMQPVSSAGGTAAMLRARSMVDLMGGEFQRGTDGGRMVFGITFPITIRTVRAP